MKKSSLELIRQFIKEQVSRMDTVGAALGTKTQDTSPYTFEDTPGYDIEIISNVNDGYMVTISYNGKKIGHSAVFRDYAEANHHARMIIDKHRVGAMQKIGQKKV